MTTDIPAVLLDYQAAWCADPAPVKIAEKSRRVGLTWAEAADDVLIAATAGSGGDDVWYIGYNQDMAKEYISTCADWAAKLGEAAGALEEVLIDDEDRDILAFRIRFASGHRITALSSRPSNLRGKQGVVVIDEAAFHGDLDELLKAAFALLIWGGRVRIISTHNGVDNPFNALCNDVRSGRRRYSLHRVDFDQALAAGLYRRICLVKGDAWTAAGEAAWRQEIIDFYGDGADEELFCVPSESGGAFLPSALVEARMIDAPVLRWSCRDDFARQPDHMREAAAADWCATHLDDHLAALDPGLMHVFGEDFGRSGDLTVIWPLAICRDLVRRTPFVVELRNVPFRQQEQVLSYIADRLPRLQAGALDARGNGQYLAERAAQRYGSGRIAEVMLSSEWYRVNMPPYKAALEDRTITLPRDGDILADHRAIVMDKGVARIPEGARAKGSDGGQRHGDSVIAAALAFFASRMDVAEYAYTAVPQADRWACATVGQGPEDDEPTTAAAAFGGRGAW